MVNPHPPKHPLKGSALKPGRFIFGDALDDEGLESCEYVVHTATPSFVCRLTSLDHTPFDELDENAQDTFTSLIFFDEQENSSYYICNRGFRLFDFVFNNPPPTAECLQRICDEAIATYLVLQSLYQEQELNHLRVRDIQVVSSKPLAPADRIEAVSSLIDLSKEAADQPVSRLHLVGAVQQTLARGDQAVLTEVQSSLLHEPKARQLLLKSARNAIAYPEIVRKDGSILSFELWAMPFIFSRKRGGVWWHFPQLERIEPLLVEALGLPQKIILWVSPTIFTVEMLNERCCQDLIHLAPIMDRGQDFAPCQLSHARATYEAASKYPHLQQLIAFIPFLVERTALSKEQAHHCAETVLDTLSPIVQNAMMSEMEISQAELLAPLPWWNALNTGIEYHNRKRLELTFALAMAHFGDTNKWLVEAKYQPETLSYEVDFKQLNTDAVVRMDWLLTPDLAPDKDHAWKMLSAGLYEMGLSVQERIAQNQAL